MTDPDFEPCLEGLHRAVELLAEQAARPRDPWPCQAPAAPWPDSLPETGAGGTAALEALAPTVLGAAARLGHPG